MRNKTIQYLQSIIDEIENNILAMKMSQEDIDINQKEIDTLKKCIEWVKKKPISTSTPHQ
jgi:hypothetical protein